MTTDPAERLHALRDSERAKAEQLMQLCARADHNGNIAPDPDTAPPAAAPAVEEPPRPDPSTLQPGASTDGPPPTLADQIAAAEQRGDYTTASRIKAAQLAGLFDQMNGAA
ncbi:hypothetical protein [Streptomyces europaeiscabiei]|uniref:hypothetical protein n=1 Tax=Streptomyces europaeiscabiei TaxID=146819 RepID=UPI0029AD0017|nr:hypothetical protein [Streptomyces europaeiscabiei]MDX3841041.1 hypothetical protein [Streptomyces europaeiscabiei]